MISGGISKINTADNLFGIFTSRALKERGRYQLQLMKTRSSSGVNSKIDLGFDVDSLRIYDLGEDAESDDTAPAASGTSKILDALKRSPTTQGSSGTEPDEGKPAPKIRAETDSAKLRNFLNNLGDE